MNTSVKVTLYTSKKLANGEHPIMLRVIKDRKPKYVSTGFSCAEALWDAKTNLPIRKHPHYKEICILVDKKRMEAQKLVLNLENDDKNLSSHEIKNKLGKKKVSNPLVMVYFDNVIQRLLDTGSIKNALVYKDTKRNIAHFINKKNIHFSDIDIVFLNRFEEFLKKAGKGDSTIYVYLRTLRALINKAIKEEICSEEYYSFKNFSLAKYAGIKTDKRAITREDIQKIRDLDIEEHPHLANAKHIFLFSYYCRGMNFIDIAYLKWKDVQGDRLVYRRKKTGELFNVKLLAPAQEIISYYKENWMNQSDYVFPIFGEQHVKPKTLYNRKEKMLRQINSDLKEVAAKCGLKTKLTTYVARHSYATNLRKSGISTSVISEAMGHDSEKTTQTYLESFGNNILDEASEAIL